MYYSQKTSIFLNKCSIIFIFLIFDSIEALCLQSANQQHRQTQVNTVIGLSLLDSVDTLNSGSKAMYNVADAQTKVDSPNYERFFYVPNDVAKHIVFETIYNESNNDQWSNIAMQTEVDSLSNGTGKSIINEPKESSQNNSLTIISIIVTIIGIVITIMVPVLMHRKQSRRNNQNVGIQVQTDKGIEALQKIQESVEHFEKLLNKDEKKSIESLLSEIMNSYEFLCVKFKSDYNHFVPNINNNEIDAKYVDTLNRIRLNINRINNTLRLHDSTVQVPDETLYLKALEDIIYRPDFFKMNEQISAFIETGKTYHQQLASMIQAFIKK